MPRPISLRGRLSRAYATANRFTDNTRTLAMSPGRYSANERDFLSDEVQLLHADLHELMVALEEADAVPDKVMEAPDGN